MFLAFGIFTTDGENIVKNYMVRKLFGLSDWNK